MTETVVISGNQVINNVSSVGEHGTGGGMMLSNGEALVHGNTVRGNVACTNGWGVGGGIMRPPAAVPDDHRQSG